MPIHILDSPEPLSESSFDKECVLVESDAERLLFEELRRYCQQECSGRSFLISGHRGAGKTTLVLNAFLKVWKDSKQTSVRMRPLLVQLHGPSLFPDPQLLAAAVPSKLKTGGHIAQRGAVLPGRRAAPVTTDGESRTGEQQARTPVADETRPADLSGESDTQVALKQITLSLHRALAREIARTFRERIEESIEESTELLELAAELEMELYECPTPARLREFWQRGGFLEHGVLFRSGTVKLPADQGFRELLALAGVSEAYCRISGTYTLEQKQKEAADQHLALALTTETTQKELFNSVFSLLSGGLVGTGVFAATASAVTATATGLAAALGAASVFRYSASRSRKRSVSRESSFLFDFSVATLDRVLPMLVERLLRAGLAPIFMVDELDKVESLSDRILGMVHHLKKFVAENAFFCFLTDRSYFEGMTRRGIDHAYPVEYTYYTHPLFIVHHHADMHRYVRRMLRRPDPSKAEAGDPHTHSQVDTLKQAEDDAEDLADYDVLPFVLLHRAQMHTLDLRRVLLSMRGQNGAISLPRGAVRTQRAYLLDLVLQLAAELVLESEDLRERLQRQPEFRRLAHDALYYPARRWQRGRELDLTDEARSSFAEYLETRGGQVLPAHRIEGNREVDEDERNVTKAVVAEKTLVSFDDVEFLYRQVRRMVELLSGAATMPIPPRTLG
jgi:hypothetical protein